MGTNNLKKSFSVNIAIISDLHCHHSSQKDPNSQKPSISSHLITDNLRKPSAGHPIQSLIDKVLPSIKEDVHFLLCPGDITNGTDPQGLISGWDFINEVAGHLKIDDVIATIGNHDVDSRQSISHDEVFKIPMKMGKSYPIKDENLRNTFWAKGFCFVEYQDIRILVLNSSRFHVDKSAALKGKVDLAQIEEIETYIQSQNDDKIQVALCHHHPFPYAINNPHPEDVFENGPELLKSLATHKFDLFIHGHRHHPFLGYSPYTGKRLPVLSVGSFSAQSQLMMHGILNSFHVLNLTKNGDNQALGIVNTWEYLENSGWRIAIGGEPNLPCSTGFGCEKNIDEICREIVPLFNGKNLVELGWDQIVKNVPEIQFLVPSELDDLESKLDKENGLEFSYNKGGLPSKIGKKYNPEEE